MNWKWNVVAPAKPEWGMPLPEELQPKPAPAPAAPGTTPAPESSAPPEARPTSYAVQKGDAIIKIARRFHMTPEQLKQFNELKDDRIVIGQVLRIPTPAEILQMPPPAPPPKAQVVEDKESEKEKAKAKESEKPKEAASGEPQTYEQMVLEIVLLQVFLDREMFSPGAIDGKSGPSFEKVTKLYQQIHPDLADPVKLKEKALAEVKQPYTSYILRAEDFKFIQPRHAKPAAGAKKPAPKKKETKTVPVLPPLTYPELVASEFLGYGSVWEFVAERFHCDEAFLRERNPRVKENPAVGAVFEVPNVIPFEIEKALDSPLQPPADPQKPVTAAVVNLARLEISREGHLIASLPLASARPGLRGRGSWTVLDAMPQPRLSTRREPREAPKTTTPASGGDASAPAVAAPAAQAEEFLASGPNNPLGILWINLSKANSTDPLPYGLHGTSIPGRMRSQEGIGGFRLANWDIARAVRLMPPGTALQWKTE